MASHALLRYALTVHFKRQGLLPKGRQLGKATELCWLVSRAVGEVRLPSQETEIEYLQRYFNEQGIRMVSPVLPVVEMPKPVRLVDYAQRAYKEKVNPGITARWKKLRKAVRARDGHECLHCGKRAKYNQLHVDHIIPWKERPDLTFDINNLQTLCASCHSTKHAEARKAA
jgi:HNH endonuclease